MKGGKTTNLYPTEMSLKKKVKIKTFSYVKVVKVFIASRPTLYDQHYKKMLKEAPQAEEKQFKMETWIYTLITKIVING